MRYELGVAHRFTGASTHPTKSSRHRASRSGLGSPRISVPKSPGRLSGMLAIHQEVTMVATVGKGIDPGYYLRCTEYYLGAASRLARGWSSRPNSERGPGRASKPPSSPRIHAGLAPDGRQLAKGGAEGRIANFDLTCSTPKSVSIAYALGTDAERAAIATAQHRAVTAVAELLGREAAFIRRGRGGRVLVPAQLSIAAFQHAEARPAPHADGRVFADMDLHTHLCIANLGLGGV